MFIQTQEARSEEEVILQFQVFFFKFNLKKRGNTAKTKVVSDTYRIPKQKTFHYSFVFVKKLSFCIHAL